MVLVVFDQGNRIQTPVSALLSPKPIEKLGQLQKSRPFQETLDHSPAFTNGKAAPRSHPAQQAYAQTEAISQPHKPESPVLSVETVMSSPVFAIRVHASTADAWYQMHAHEVQHLAVLDNERHLRGIISEQELLRRSIAPNQAGPTRWLLPLQGAYAEQMIVATPGTDILQVALTFLNKPITCIPVLDKEGHLAGVVTRSDLLHLITNGDHIERWA